MAISFERRSPACDSERAGNCFERIAEGGLEKRLGREMTSRRSMRKETAMRSARKKRVEEEAARTTRLLWARGAASYTGKVSKFRAYHEAEVTRMMFE